MKRSNVQTFKRLVVGAFDPGLIIALAFGLIAAWPFLSRPSLPLYTDAEMHVYRAGEILFSLQEGILWPRWAPDFYYGYGYPLFNYYSPLTYHLAAVYARLTHTDVVAGTKAVFVLALLLGAAGVYGFVRDRWGALAGLVAGAAFVTSPYVIFIDPHARGDSPEIFAIGVAPMMFWAFDRLHRDGRAGAFIAAAALLAVLVLSHPLMALIFFALLIAWRLWATFVAPLAPNGEDIPLRRHARLWLVALGVGLGLAALYWLPVLLERQAIQLHNVAGPGFFDFRNYFLDLSELVGPSRLLDLGATQPAFNYNLGWPQVFLAALGAIAVLTPGLRRVDAMFFVFAAVGFIYLMTDASLQVWESIPQMSFLQFPTRFLGPAALTFAVLGGGVMRWLRLVPWPDGSLGRKWVESGVAATLCLTCLAGALPLMYPPGWGEFGAVTPGRMIGVELSGRALGTTSAGDFLPAGVLRVPDPQPGYLRPYDQRPLNKVNTAAVPGTAGVQVLEHSAIHDLFFTGAMEPFTLRLFTFYFPGWKAYVDGREVPIEVSVPEGFITIRMPTGPHEVLVRFEDTWPRKVGYALSGVSLLALAAIGLRLRRAQRGSRMRVALGLPAAASAAVVLIAFVTFKAISDRAGWCRLVSTGNTVLVAEHSHYARLGSSLALLGFDLPRSTAHPGQEVPVTLYWKALTPVGRNYQAFVHLMGPDGRLWGQSDKLNPADFPTRRWPLDRYVRDEHEARLAADAPPGVYTIVVGLWDAAAGRRLPVFDAADRFVGSDGVVLSRALIVEP